MYGRACEEAPGLNLAHSLENKLRKGEGQNQGLWEGNTKSLLTEEDKQAQHLSCKGYRWQILYRSGFELMFSVKRSIHVGFANGSNLWVIPYRISRGDGAFQRALLQKEPSDLVKEILQLLTTLHPEFLQSFCFDLTYPLTTHV
jgi:hypothetical protein